MSMLSVAEAADELGVSARRVRQMLADGVLDGERVGRAWIIDRERLHRVAGLRPEVGRPWSPVSAWAVLALADGEQVDLSPVERSRARKRLGQGLGHLVGRLAARCERRRFYAHPGVLDRLADELVRAGASAAAHCGADLVIGESVEGYVRAGEIDRLVKQFGLDEQAARPNVLLRMVEDDAWPFESDQRYAARSVVGVDLLESEEPRSRRAGAELLAR
ncbi:MAG: helix-turn-helix domain-containing protein [Acidimicrobiales bacterium]